MDGKTQIICMLRDEFNRWEGLLSGISEVQITAPNRMEAMSIKDIVAHLTAWQQISVARMEAALLNREPEFPKWPAELDPESDDDLDKINAWIYETQREKPWPDIHNEWRERYLRFIGLGEAIPEKDLLEVGKYHWIEGYALAAVLVSSYEHHEEHLQPLLILLGRDKKG